MAKLTRKHIINKLNEVYFLDCRFWEYDKESKKYYGVNKNCRFYLEPFIARAIVKAYINKEIDKEIADNLDKFIVQSKAAKIDAVAIDELTQLQVISNQTRYYKLKGNCGLNEGFNKNLNNLTKEQSAIAQATKQSTLTVKEVAESLKQMINATTGSEGKQYYIPTKCGSSYSIVHSGYPLVPELLFCMLEVDHTAQHCATDKNGRRVNWK